MVDQQDVSTSTPQRQYPQSDYWDQYNYLKTAVENQGLH